MSAFECNLTPTRIREARKRSEDREPTIVDLRPFTGKAIVTFEDVPVTKIARRFLKIVNPFSEKLIVSIVKKPKGEFNLNYEWQENIIPPDSQIEMEMLWSPLKVVSTREVLEISDQFGNKKSISVILKSCELKKLAPRKTGLVKTLKMKATPLPPLKQPPFSSNVVSKESTFSDDYTVENIRKVFVNDQVSPLKKKPMTPMAHKSPLRNSTNLQSTQFEENLNGTPRNATLLFEDIKFTPLTETRPRGESKLEYLSSLPTPSNLAREDIVCSTSKRMVEVRGIEYSPEIEMTETQKLSLKTPAIANRETFGSALYETPSRKTTVTTTVRTLASKMIHHVEEEEEEEIYVDADFASNTYIKGPCEIDEINIVITTSSGNTTMTQTTTSTTFQINKSKSLIESIETDFDCNKIGFSESMREENNGEKIKNAIQGSMPNLCDISEKPMPIDHNRYYNQQHVAKAQDISMESVVSNTDFREFEIGAASSRLNLHEIECEPKSSSPILCENENHGNKTLKVESELAAPEDKNAILIFSPPRNRLGDDIQQIFRRETFLVKQPPPKKTPKSPYVFVVPKIPRDIGMRARECNQPISLSLTSLSSSMSSIASTSSVPTTNGKLYNENVINAYTKVDPFSATTTEDPFLTSSLYLDERTLDGIEKSFKKWLNALVTIPPDLEVNKDEKIDVAKLFNDVQNKELTIAPTKEIVCSQYYTARLDSLRTTAVKYFHSEEISKVLNKLVVIINEKKLLEVHSARCIHLDLVLQRGLLELLLCYNPLWLRIGLEVVFNVQLNLHSNHDIFGLSRFIINNMFKSPYLQQKYSKYHQQDELQDKLKKHTAKHFLFILFFLDHAKENKLIKQNPCLFMKTAPYKESNEILKKFASLVLANYGDILRMMKRINYVLSHKQTVIDEFDYSFKNLAIDLRDGVRLTKIMEIILLRDDLVKRVRVPAISRLQKVHNVDLALKALQDAEYKIMGNITAKDIADGHREKTLSLLWQIIYKFRSPRFIAAAKIIQKFWRAKWLKIVIERRVQLKEEERRIKAATVIQKYFRGWKLRRDIKAYRERVEKSVIVFQKLTRGFLQRKKILRMKTDAITIQRWFKSIKVAKQTRIEYQKTRLSIMKIQKWWRRQILVKKIIATADFIKEIQKEENHAAIKIQKYFRGYLQMKKVRVEFLRDKNAIIKAQQRYHCKLIMRQIQHDYQVKRNLVIKIQQYWRATVQMRIQRTQFLIQKYAAVKIQHFFRSYQLMKQQKNQFLQLKSAAIIFQNRFRALQIMKAQRNQFLIQKSIVIKIQRYWRGYQQTKLDSAEYKRVKEVISKAQKRYRGKLLMRKVKREYETKRNAAITIQRKWRATIQMRIQCENYQSTVSQIIFIQRKFQAKLAMRRERENYQKLKAAAIIIQQRYHAYLKMKESRQEFLKVKNSVIIIENRFIAIRQMRIERENFKKIKYSATAIQRWYRNTILRQKIQFNYTETKRSILLIQKWWRQQIVARKLIAVSHLFNEVRNEKLKAQNEAAIKIQKYFRGYLQMKKDRVEFLREVNAIIMIQQRYHCKLIMRQIQHDYQVKRNAIIKIQQFWRAKVQMRAQREIYQLTISRIVFMQRNFREKLLARKTQLEFQKLKSSAITLQRRFRARLAMMKCRNQYLKLKRAVIMVENCYIATKLMKEEREKFLELRKNVVYAQRRFRMKLETRKLRKEFVATRKSVFLLQTHSRGYLARRFYREHLATPENLENRRRHQAARTIQAAWRGFKERSKKCNILFRAIVQRLIKVSKNVDPTQTLGAKLKMSIDFLKNRYDTNVAIATLAKLEYMSRTVPWILTEDAEFISAFCYGLMAQAIRSEIDKQIIELCSCIILNLGRYSNTKEDAFQQSGLITIASMLLRWCDKDCGIFNTLCTLIWVFAQCPNKKKIIRKFMMMKDGEFILAQIKQSVARKENMRRNSKRPIGFQSISLVKYKKDYQLQLSHQPQTVYSSGYITPEMMKQCRQLPTLEPDYGVVRMHPYIFYSSVYAYETVLKSLGIHSVK